MYLYNLENTDARLPVLVREKAVSEKYVSFESPAEIVAMLNTHFNLQRKAEEYVYLICTDTKLHIIGVFEVSHGIVDGSFANPREIFIRAILCGATHIIIVHNHPSGDPTPSGSDYCNYENIKSASEIMGINLLDSIIIGEGCYFSINENK